jgi:hypothetical protein
MTRRGWPPRLSAISDAAMAYRLVYHRVEALLRQRPEVADRSVPACPAWTIRQTVAHLAGVAQDIVSLNVENKAADCWTQAQVDRLGGHSSSVTIACLKLVSLCNLDPTSDSPHPGGLQNIWSLEDPWEILAQR